MTTTGNDNNTIENNDITCSDDANRPINAILSRGTAAKQNSEIIIRNNNIYNFFNRGATSCGVYLAQNTTACSVLGNSFYEKASFVPTNAIAIYNTVKIENPSGDNFIVSDNYIGGQEALCGGSAWTKTNTGNNPFYAIYIQAGTAIASSIQNNKIQNFNWSNSSNAIWKGIWIVAGNADVGTTTGNVIGAPGSGLITITGKGTSTAAPSYAGIEISSPGTVDCQNNSIESITLASSDNDYGCTFRAIYKTNTIGITTINKNTIRNIIASSPSSTGAQSVYGIHNAGSGVTTISENLIANLQNLTTNSSITGTGIVNGITTLAGTNIITNNTVRDLTIANGNASGSSISSSAAGVVHDISTSTQGGVITGNTVSNISNSNASFTGNVIGIYFSGGKTSNNVSNNTVSGLSSSASTAATITGIYFRSTLSSVTNSFSGNTVFNLSLPNTAAATEAKITGLDCNISSASSINTIEKNYVHSFSMGANSTTGVFYGIYLQPGTSTYSNNIVNLGGDSKTTIYGIYDNGSTPFLYHNTVYLSGTLAAASTNKSYCLYSAVASTTRNYRNNVFHNNRSTISGASMHYAIFIPDKTNLICDYNDYWASGTGGVLGSFGTSTIKLDCPKLYKWRAATTQDVHSKQCNPYFANAGGILAADYIPSSIRLFGVSGTGITDDYIGVSRGVRPSMGAYQIYAAMNVEIWKEGVFQAEYTTVNAAFNDINAGIYKGALEVRVNSSTYEDALAVLYESGHLGLSDYSSVNLFPTDTDVEILGKFPNPLITLNGADNVVFDGRVNATGITKGLTISNMSGGAFETSTIRFINDATNNTVKHCTITGSTVSETSGVICFSTTTGTTGNDNNTIDSNDITCFEDLSRPTNAVYSSGTVTKENNGIIISNNNIYNFFTRGTVASNGINLLANTTACSILGNSFYETTTFLPGANAEYLAININSPLGDNFTVSGNFIGGTAPSCGGSAWSKSFTSTLNTGSNNFAAIFLNVGTNSASNIQNNRIQNISWSNKSTSTWTGIYLNGGNINVGTTTGNVIGAPATGLLTLTSAGSPNFYGILMTGSGTKDCQNNYIESIILNHTSDNPINFWGIKNYSTLGTIIISNNHIGNSDIIASSPSTGSAQYVYGIHSSGVGLVTISGNEIANLKNLTTSTAASAKGLVNGIYTMAGTNIITTNTVHDLIIGNANNDATETASAAGIVHNSTGANVGVGKVSGNNVYNISNSYSSFAGNVNGIYFGGGLVGNEVSNNTVSGLSAVATTAASVTGIKVNTTVITNTVSGNTIYNLSLPNTATATAANIIGMSFAAGIGGTNTVNQNFIHSLSTSAASTIANIYGLKIVSGATTYSNNIVTLGGSTTTNIYGIFDTGAASQTCNLYHNTIYVGGEPTIGTNPSYALYSAASSNIRNYKNNVFYNARNNNGASGNHYATYFNYSSTTNLTASYNNYYAPNTGGVLSYFNGSNSTSLPIAIDFEKNSLNKDPKLINAGSTIAEDYKVGIVLIGGQGIDVYEDFGTTPRVLPTMGAWEGFSDLPINLIKFTVDCNENNALLKWQTASEINNNYFEIEQSSDLKNWTVVKKHLGQGNSNSIVNYSFVDEKAYSNSYYRLVQVDYDGTRTLFAPTFFSCDKTEQTYKLYPNPANDYIVVEIPEIALNTTYQLFSSLGKPVVSGKFSELSNQIDVRKLSAGIYYLRLEKAPSVVLKIVKQ